MVKRPSYRKDQYAERIKNEINSILRKELSDSRLRHVTITKVELSADFSSAKVFWDTYDAQTRGDAKKAINSAGSKVRSILANLLKVRHTPALSFEYDSQFESEKAITKILKAEVKIGKSY